LTAAEAASAQDDNKMFKKFNDLKLFKNCKLIISNFLEYGLYLLVFLLPWQTKLILRQSQLNHGVWEYGTIALYGTDILLLFLLAIFAINSLFNRKIKNQSVLNSDLVRESSMIIDHSFGNAQDESRSTQDDKKRQDDKKNRVWREKKEKGIVAILSCLDLFVLISVFIAPDFFLAIYHYIIFLFGLSLFWLIVKTKLSYKKLAIAFFSGLVIQSCLAVWQFLTQATFACKWLGLAAHAPGDLGTSVVETIGSDGVSERWLRAYGSLDHPNVLGGFLAIGLLILIWKVINHQRANKKTDCKFIIYHLSLIILIAGLILTFSRSSYLAMAAGIIIYFVVYLSKKDWPVLKRLGLALLIGAFLAGLAFASYHDLFLTRAEASSRLEAKSISERQMYFNDSFGMIKGRWLIGAGIGNYTNELSLREPKRPWYYLNPVHNVFLLLFSEIGFFGMICFIALLIYLFAQSWLKKNVLNLSILSALVIIMMFDHYLWSLHFGVLFFWAIIGVVYKNLSLNS
jgi:hypothetical protein